MKLAKNDRDFIKTLEKAVPYHPLSPKAKECFEETYRILGPKQEGPKRHHRVWITALSAVAACFLLLFGTNAAFPAFAEELPLIGGFFQGLNQRNDFQRAAVRGKTAQGTNTGELAQPISAGEQSGSYAMNVESAFCDGQILTVFLTMTMPEETAKPVEYALAETSEATVNGVSASHVDGSNRLFWPTKNPGEFVATLLYSLPEPAENGETLQVQLKMADFSGKDTAVSDYRDHPLPLDGAAFELTFTADVQTDFNRDFDCQAEDKGFVLHHVEASPVRTRLNLTVPASSRGTEPYLYLMDGTRRNFNLSYSDEVGGFYGFPNHDSFTADLYFDGLPAGTQQAVLRLYSDNYDEVLAEFTLDLESGTAQTSATYEQDGVLALDGPYDYMYLECEGTNGGRLVYNESEAVNGFQISSLSWYAPDGGVQIGVYHTSAPYREIKAEVLNAQGDVVAEKVSENSSVCNSSLKTWYFDENCEAWNRGEGESHYSYHFYTTSNYLPACGEALTVRITDAQTGEELATKDLLMNEKFF